MTKVKVSPGVADLTWWKARFSVGYPEAGPPLFRRRSNVYRRKSGTIVKPFSDELSRRLQDAGGHRPDRIHQLFFAGLAGVLYRYTGSDQPEGIVVGTPLPATAAARDGANQAAPLPVLLRVEADLSFQSLLDAAATSIAESNQRADVAMPDLLEALGMGEVADRHPMFPSVLGVEGYHGPLQDVRNDVTLTVSREGALRLDYNQNVCDERSIERLGAHVLAFLNHGLAQPSKAVRSIEYLGSVERSELLQEWSLGPVAEPDGRCLHELVEEAAHRNLGDEAIVWGEQSISYAELDRRANQLAHHLRQRRVGRRSRVGLCLEPSFELLIGVLAIMKAGAAVVPLVPTFPALRNAMVIEDSAMNVAVTQASLRDRFPSGGPELVFVDTEAEQIAQAAATNPEAGVRPDDLLYVLFTSGSTGRPKGVAMEHGAIVNLVRWQRERGADPAGRRTLQRTSIGFDVSFQEIFSTLAFGGSLVIAPNEVRDDVSLLPEYIERYAIGRLFLPPVALDQLAVSTSLQQRSLPALKELIVAGEQLQVSMPVRRFFHEVDCSLDNQYGPTETHVVTAFALEGPSTRWPEKPPIGKPVRNVAAYVLDSWRQPVPAGVPGEIYVGGVALARGYLDETQTAERFFADPFASKAGGRIYKTGDRARFLNDGTLEFLGRLDDQVKIRGYRIELGEIEANLLSVPGILRAAVAVHDSDVAGKQLVAYVVTHEQGRPDPARIREFLLGRLPGHMVPAVNNIVSVKSLPLTPTGKLDRRALPPPPRAAVNTASAAAKGDTEQTVAAVWCQALAVERVGRDDNFIDLGGHSMLAIQIVSQLNEVYHLTLPLRTVLRGTTVAQLSSEIDRLRGLPGDGASATAPPPTSSPAPAAGTPVMENLQLPNGRRITCPHRAEAEYLYLDVFEHHTYDRGGIRYPETGYVFDVGAHVGLFTMYALEKSPSLQVIACEPCPPLFAALRRNTDGMSNVRTFPFGLSNTRDVAELTFYPNLTGMSSFHPDDAQERALLSGILQNLADLGERRGSGLLATSKEYLDERLVAQTFRCERRTLSDVLAETGIARVELLKIDVQKAELEVLEGILEEDWKKILQLAIEVHDLGGRLKAITTLLARKGYRVTVEQDGLHSGTPVHFVYAVEAPR